jgi:adenylylsulfate kinase-like enzyme
MVAETNLGASFETPRQLENLDGSSSERPNLDLEKPKEVAEPKMETATQSAPAPVINTVKLVTPYEERRRNIEMTLAKNLVEIYLQPFLPMKVY